MIDEILTLEIERKTLKAVFPALIDVITEIGLEKLTADYTEEEAIKLIKKIVEAYQVSLKENAPLYFPLQRKFIYACYA